MVQLKNQRPGEKRKTEYSTDCLQQLKKFLAEPPDGLCIYHDKVVCEPKEVRIPFSVSGTQEVFQDCGLSAFLLDFTHKTNRDGLLFGCIGAAGLLSQARSLPTEPGNCSYSRRASPPPRSRTGHGRPRARETSLLDAGTACWVPRGQLRAHVPPLTLPTMRPPVSGVDHWPAPTCGGAKSPVRELC